MKRIRAETTVFRIELASRSLLVEQSLQVLLESPYALEVAMTLLVVGIYLGIDRFTSPKLVEGADQSNLKDTAVNKAIGIVRIVTLLAAGLVLAAIWRINLTSVLVFTGTALTLIGVAFFASWSLLSNATACFVLLLHPSFRRGNFIRIIDADTHIEGYIADVTPFNSKLISESREVVVIPNNMIVGRPAVVDPRDRGDTVGKIPISPGNDISN